MGCVYVWTNKVNGKQYVGMSIEPEVRKKSHLFAIRSGNGCYAFHNAVRKYGREAFTYEEVFWSDDRQELAAREIAEIAQRGTFKDPEKGYNLTPGGEGITDLTPESKAKKSASQKATFARPEVKAKKSAALKAAHANPAAGFTSPEFKANHSAGVKAAHARPEVKAKRSFVFASPEVKAKISAGLDVANTRPEVKAKRSVASRTSTRSRSPNVFAEGLVFRSQSLAGQHFGVLQPSVCARIRSTSERFRWWHTIPNHNDPACDAVEETWAIMQWAKVNPDHPNVPDWALPDRPKHGKAPAWAQKRFC